MAGITLEQAQTQLAAYLAAETKVLANQSYEIAGRKLTRANLGEIREGIKHWDDQVKHLSAVASRGRSSRSVSISPR
jgi:hypothetical protein